MKHQYKNNEMDKETPNKVSFEKKQVKFDDAVVSLAKEGNIVSDLFFF